MKRITFISILMVLLLSACEKDPYVIPGGNTNPQTELIANFDYIIEDLCVSFINKSSSSLKVLMWYFGDGASEQNSNKTIHVYNNYGKYEVKLVCVDNNNKQYICAQKIELVNNNKCPYITGYTLYNIPYSGRYYKMSIAGYVFTGAEDFNIGTEFTTTISNSELPFKRKFSTPYKLAESIDALAYFDHFTVWVYQSKSASSKGDQCLKQDFKINVNNLQHEYVLTSNNKETQIGISIEYK